MNKTIPHYYIGKTYKIEARKIIEDYQADNYNLGVAISYLLRCGKKEGHPAEQDIQKAIDHLHFELDRLSKQSKVLTGGLAQ